MCSHHPANLRTHFSNPVPFDELARENIIGRKLARGLPSNSRSRTLQGTPVWLTPSPLKPRRLVGRRWCSPCASGARCVSTELHRTRREIISATTVALGKASRAKLAGAFSRDFVGMVQTDFYRRRGISVCVLCADTCHFSFVHVLQQLQIGSLSQISSTSTYLFGRFF